MKYWISAVALISAAFLIFIFTFSIPPPQKGVVHIHKPVELPKSILPLNDKTIFYFGYVGCETMCIPRMKEIAKLYEAYGKNDLDIIFINLDNISSTNSAMVFARSFHPDFRGITLPKKELLQLTRILKAYFSTSLKNSQEIDHSLFLYDIRKDSNQNYFLNNIFTITPYDIPTIINELNKEPLQ